MIKRSSFSKLGSFDLGYLGLWIWYLFLILKYLLHSLATILLWGVIFRTLFLSLNGMVISSFLFYYKCLNSAGNSSELLKVISIFLLRAKFKGLSFCMKSKVAPYGIKLGNLSIILCSGPLNISIFFNKSLLNKFLGNYLLIIHTINYSGLFNKNSE